MSPGCKPGRGCLICELPAEACEHSGQKVFLEEREMILVVGRETMEHGRPKKNKIKDRSR
jgi:hypothetical protein